MTIWDRVKIDRSEETLRSYYQLKSKGYPQRITCGGGYFWLYSYGALHRLSTLKEAVQVAIQKVEYHNSPLVRQ